MKVRAHHSSLKAVACAVAVFTRLALQAATITGGTTTVTFDPSTLSVLTGAGFSVAPVTPATLGTSPVAAMFPITGGDTTTNITHSGGLNLTRSSTMASLTNLNIDLTNNTLLGTVTAAGTSLGNVALFDLSSSAGSIVLSLDPALASGINTVFGVPLAAGTRIGTAAVSASVAPEPATIGISVLGMVGVWAISASFRQRAKQ